MGQNITYRILGIPVFEKRVDSGQAEQRSNVVSELKDPKDWLSNFFGFSSSSGVPVNEKSALTLSSVWAAIRILSESLAMLPLNVFTIDEARNRKLAYQDPLYDLLHNQPNALMTSVIFREVMQLHHVLSGNAYAFINKDRFGNVAELELIDNPRGVYVTTSNFDGRKYFSVEGKTYSNDEILHIFGLSFDGIKGVNPIQYHRESMGEGIALQKFGGSFFRNGARSSGVIEVPTTLKDEAYERLKKSFQEMYGGLDNVGKTILLEGGAKYNPVSLTNEDAEYLLSRQFSVEEIARMFRVPQHMIGNLTHSTNNNIEHQGIEFSTHTMTPHVMRWEQEMNNKLIPIKDKGRKYVKFQMNGLLRGDSAARAAFYKELFYAGAISPDEIREMEEMNHYEGGDKYYVPVNMLPAELAGKNIKTQPEK